MEEIAQLWKKGEDVRGWARYWSHLHGFLAEQLEENTAVGKAAMIVLYDDLCSDSRSILSQLFKHCELDSAQQLIEHYTPKLKRPRYYQPSFTSDEERIIEQETADVFARFTARSHATAGACCPTTVRG
jgi:hypothetical protein